MLVFEEEGIKQSFKIILNTKGMIIKTRGIFSTSYKDVYSRPYREISNIHLINKFIQTVFVLDGITLNFSDNADATLISRLVTLGKMNTDRLVECIGPDYRSVDLHHLTLEEVEDKISLEQFNSTTPGKQTQQKNEDDIYRVGESPAATLTHILNMRLKAAEADRKTQDSAPQQTPAPPPIAQEPTTPPPISAGCFSFYAYIEGKQQGPYDEKQFGNLVRYGLVNADTPVWKEGMDKWQKASTVAETKVFFRAPGNATPPPLPID